MGWWFGFLSPVLPPSGSAIPLENRAISGWEWLRDCTWTGKLIPWICVCSNAEALLKPASAYAASSYPQPANCSMECHAERTPPSGSLTQVRAYHHISCLTELDVYSTVVFLYYSSLISKTSTLPTQCSNPELNRSLFMASMLNGTSWISSCIVVLFSTQWLLCEFKISIFLINYLQM